jgi:transglutaminase-like putative cysteine protease
MRLSITHTTEYRYETPLAYALQRVRLTPQNSFSQSVVSWAVTLDGAKRELSFHDHFGNATMLISADGDPHVITIRASGIVDTTDTSGVTGETAGFAPLWLFLRETSLTTPGKAIRDLAQLGQGPDTLSGLHRIMAVLGEHLTFDDGATAPVTTARQAWDLRRGVCQDYAHIFCAAARGIGIPARYVSGYLMLNDRIDQAASHAWAEAHVAGLGWVGFDAANGICPDARYVRLAVGLDYRDAAPVSGIRVGSSNESLAVQVRVEQ